ncbi:CASR protein, partial [Polypterus senegalus]
MPLFSKDGDITIGGIFSLHDNFVSVKPTFNDKPEPLYCKGSMPVAMSAAMALVNGNEETVYLNRTCSKTSATDAIIGLSDSSTTRGVAATIGSFQIPLISHTATCACLSNRKEYPSFFRTIPSDFFQSRTLAKLVKHFGWKWIGAIRSDNDYGNGGMATFLQEAQNEGICVDFSESIYRTYPRDKFLKTVDVIKKSSAKVIVAFSSSADLAILVKELLIQNVTGLQWIGSESWVSSVNLAKPVNYRVLGGAIGFIISSAVIPGLKEFFLNINPIKSPGWNELWENIFNCTFATQDKAGNINPCTGSESLQGINHVFMYLSELRIINNVYKAVYSIAYALHDLLMCQDGQGPFANKTCANQKNIQPWQLLHYMNKVHFITKSGENVYFDENGDSVARYELVNWQLTEDGTVKYITVGLYDASLPEGQQFKINNSIIVWAEEKRQISHFATCACLSNKRDYPTFFRTIPSDYHQSRALVQLVKYFGWNWVGAIKTDNEYGNGGMATFVEVAKKEGICIEYLETFTKNSKKEVFLKIINLLQTSTSKVVVAFVTLSDMEFLTNELLLNNVTGMQWIGSESWASTKSLATATNFRVLGGTLGFAISNAVVAGLKEFSLKIRPSDSPGWAEFWENIFGCSLTSQDKTVNACTGFETLRDVNNEFTDFTELRITNNVYKAVYAVAHSLHNLLSCNDDKGPFANNSCANKANFEPWQIAAAMMFTIEEINNRSDILPGIILGYKIFDACGSTSMAVRAAMALMAEQNQVNTPNKSCTRSSSVPAIIGHSGSSQTIGITATLGPFNIPVISHFATCACLSDKKEYPTFFRTIPSDYYQSRALVKLVKYFGWTWVGAIRSDGNYGNFGMATFLQLAEQEGICVEYAEAVKRSNLREKFLKVVDIIKQSTAKVIVAFTTYSDFEFLVTELTLQNVTGLQWVGSESWASTRNLATPTNFRVLGGTIGFGIPNVMVPGLKEYILNINPSKEPGWNELWESTFSCSLSAQKQTASVKPCTGMENLKQVNNDFTTLTEQAIHYNMYKAVYALGYALHNMLSCSDGQGPFINRTCADKKKIQPWQVLQYLKTTNFKTKIGEYIYFDKYGDPPAKYEILNWQLNTEGIVKFALIGLYDASLPEGQQFIMNNNSIIWTVNQTKLLPYLKTVNFTFKNGENVHLEEDANVQYEVINWQLTSEGMTEFITVGYYDTSLLVNQRFTMKNIRIIYTGNQTQVTTMMFTIEEINNRTDILPNISLGYRIYDSCGSTRTAVKSALALTSDAEGNWTESCLRSSVHAIVGHSASSPTIAIARAVGPFHIPLLVIPANTPSPPDGALPAVWRCPEDQQGVMDYVAFIHDPAGYHRGHKRELQGGPKYHLCPITRKYVIGRATCFRGVEGSDSAPYLSQWHSRQDILAVRLAEDLYINFLWAENPKTTAFSLTTTSLEPTFNKSRMRRKKGKQSDNASGRAMFAMADAQEESRSGLTSLEKLPGTNDRSEVRAGNILDNPFKITHFVPCMYLGDDHLEAPREKGVCPKDNGTLLLEPEHMEEDFHMSVAGEGHVSSPGAFWEGGGPRPNVCAFEPEDTDLDFPKGKEEVSEAPLNPKEGKEGREMADRDVGKLIKTDRSPPKEATRPSTKKNSKSQKPP